MSQLRPREMEEIALVCHLWLAKTDIALSESEDREATGSTPKREILALIRNLLASRLSKNPSPPDRFSIVLQGIRELAEKATTGERYALPAGRILLGVLQNQLVTQAEASHRSLDTNLLKETSILAMRVRSM